MKSHIRLLCCLVVLRGTPALWAQDRADLPPGAIARLGVDRRAAMHMVADAVLTPDERTLIIRHHPDRAEKKPNIILVDADTGTKRYRLPIYGALNFAQARDKPLLVAATPRGIELWNWEKRERLRQWPYPFKGEADKVKLTISCDGARVGALIASDYFFEWVAVWDAARDQPLFHFKEDHYVDNVQLSPEGDRLFLVNPYMTYTKKGVYRKDKARIAIVDAKTGTQFGTETYDYDLIDLSPHCDKVVGYLQDAKKLHLFDRARPNAVTELFADQVYGKRFTPDGRHFLFAFSSKRGYVTACWDVKMQKETHRIHGRYLDERIHPGNHTMLAHDGADWIQRWNLKSGAMQRYRGGHPSGVGGIAYSPDGKLLASFSRDTIVIFDLGKGTELRQWVAHSDNVTQIAFAPDGKLLASASTDGTIALWDPHTGKLKRRLDASAPVHSIAFSWDGAMLTSACVTKHWQVWDVAQGTLVRAQAFATEMHQPCVAPHADCILGFEHDHLKKGYQRGGSVANILRTELGNQRRLTFSATVPFKTAISPDGKLLAASTGRIVGWGWGPESTHHEIRVHEIATRSEIMRIVDAPRLFPTELLAFSPDNRILVHGIGEKGDTALIFHDITQARNRTLGAGKDQTWTENWAQQTGFLQLNAHYAHAPWYGCGVTCLAFSPDGKFLATGGQDGMIIVWNLAPFFKPARIGPALKEIDDLWKNLSDLDAGKAYRAIAQLQSTRDAAYALMRRHVRPAPATDKNILAKHLQDLNSGSFAVRQRAQAALSLAPLLAAPLLREALPKHPSLEARRRMEGILETLDYPIEKNAEALAAYRSLILLERIGSREARTLLAELADGAPTEWLTIEARRSMRRVTR